MQPVGVGSRLQLQRGPRARQVLQRRSQARLGIHVDDLAGTRQTELARRMGISKQAVNQLVSELAGFGVIERVPDPSDGRALLVRFTPEGARSLFDGLAVLHELDAELRKQLGGSRMDALLGP